MAVPKQVQKQTEAVQALYNDLNTSDGSPAEGETVVTEVVVREVPPADSADEVVPEPTSTEPGAGGQGEDWQQKYQTLQGMYNADVPRLNAQVQELTQRSQQMEQLVATMQTATPTPEPASTPAPVVTLTEEEVDEYGGSIDIMRKVSQEVAGQYQKQMTDMQATIDQLKGTVVPRVEQLASQQAQSAEQAFWASLQSTVPDWREVNDNQDFQSWLLETDPLSGLSRQTYLDDAQRNLDVTRVASFFTSWAQVGTTTAHPNRTAANSELEKQVIPGKGRNSGMTQVAEVRTYTPQDITDFFAKVRSGGFKGKEKERNNTERDIFAAQAEGRIVPARK